MMDKRENLRNDQETLADDCLIDNRVLKCPAEIGLPTEKTDAVNFIPAIVEENYPENEMCDHYPEQDLEHELGSIAVESDIKVMLEEIQSEYYVKVVNEESHLNFEFLNEGCDSEDSVWMATERGLTEEKNIYMVEDEPHLIKNDSLECVLHNELFCECLSIY